MTQSNPMSDNPAANTIAGPTSSAWLEQYERERLENVRQHLPEARRQLQEAGVEGVHIHYDGCGDSGSIESITYTGAHGKPVDLAGKTTITENQLTNLFYDLAQARHPGWENYDGAFGEFDWDLTIDTLKHTHNDRITDYDTTEHEGL
jgi:hypothetical protein